MACVPVLRNGVFAIYRILLGAALLIGGAKIAGS
jgi:hypothetical protein